MTCPYGSKYDINLYQGCQPGYEKYYDSLMMGYECRCSSSPTVWIKKIADWIAGNIFKLVIIVVIAIVVLAIIYMVVPTAKAPKLDILKVEKWRRKNAFRY